MRELSEYEKKKWFDDMGRFEVPEFVMHGAELGHAYNNLEAVAGCTYYGLSDEFVEALHVEILDQYYDQFKWLYLEEQDDPQRYGLPPYDLLPKDVSDTGELWDWAMDWREEHKEETWKRDEAERLKQRLKYLEA